MPQSTAYRGKTESLPWKQEGDVAKEYTNFPADEKGCVRWMHATTHTDKRSHSNSKVSSGHHLLQLISACVLKSRDKSQMQYKIQLII